MWELQKQKRGFGLLSFMQFDLGYFDEDPCRVEPLNNPFKEKLLPMCPVWTWIKHVKQNQPERLTVAPGRGRKKILSDEQIALVKGWIEADTQLTIDQLQRRIRDELNASLSRSSTHRLMVFLNFSYFTPRSKHYKQDPLQQDDFKKTEGKNCRYP
jgi:transposase